MRLSERYPVPRDVALLYEFANSLDLRRFVEQGAPHHTGDEIGAADQLRGWMTARGLLDEGASLGPEDHRQALELRRALRDFIEGPRRSERAAALSGIAADLPLVLRVGEDERVALEPAPGSSGLGRILAELHQLDAAGGLDRLKMCASDECHWVFYDRSKPGNRRWCSSALCGNREKTRSYRARKREGGDS